MIGKDFIFFYCKSLALIVRLVDQLQNDRQTEIKYHEKSVVTLTLTPNYDPVALRGAN